MGKKAPGTLMIAGMVVSWTAYYAASKMTVAATGSAFLAGLLLRAAAFVFLTAQLIAEKKLRDIFRQGRVAYILLLIGCLGFLLDTFANLGYSHGSLSTGTALLKTDVLMANLATVVIYKKKLYSSDWAGTIIMLVGVLMVLGVDFSGFTLNWYDLFFIASALCVTVNAFIIKAAQDKFKADTEMISYYNNFMVLLLFFASSAATGDIRSLHSVGGSGFWWIVVLGGLAQTLIYFFYYRNLKRYEVWMVKLYLLLMPVLSCALGVVFLNERLTAEKALGIAVVLLGAAVILLRGRINKQEG